MSSDTAKTLEQSQEQSFMDLVQVRYPDLDRTRPIGMIFPYANKPIEKLVDHVTAYNLDDAPDLGAIEDKAATLRQSGFNFISAAIIFPNHSVAEPMGAHSLLYNGTPDKMDDFCRILKLHNARAENIATVQEFNDAWIRDGQAADKTAKKRMPHTGG